MKRPLLFLDVDGVLNVSGPNLGRRGRTVYLKPEGRPLHPTPYVLPFLRWAWKHLDVVWCTTWCRSADMISDWARLSRVPVIEMPQWYVQATRRGDWKLEGVRAMLAREARQAFWIEDGLLDQGQKWMARRPNAYYLATDSFEGVTPCHVKLIQALAGIKAGVPK